MFLSRHPAALLRFPVIRSPIYQIYHFSSPLSLIWKNAPVRTFFSAAVGRGGNLVTAFATLKISQSSDDQPDPIINTENPV